MPDEIAIYPTTKYWIYVLNNAYSPKLLDSFKKHQYYLSSHKNYNINENDIIFIYQKNSTIHSNNGFIGLCQVSSKMIPNGGGIKIFKDANMNKYFVELSFVLLFDKLLAMKNVGSSLIEHDNNFNINSFKTKYLRDFSVFKELKKYGKEFVQIFVELDDLNNYPDDKISLSSVESIASVASVASVASIASIASAVSTDSIVKKITGNIPILMIPCKKMRWYDCNESTIKSFKKHYLHCKKCEKIDNNEISFSFAIDRREIYCSKLKKYKLIDKLISLYQNLENYKFILHDDDMFYEHIYLYKIRNKDHDYNGCILIVW